MSSARAAGLRALPPLLRHHPALTGLAGASPAVLAVPAGEVDHAGLFRVHREATAKVIRKAMRGEPTIDWLLENQDKVEHYFHRQGIEGKL